MGAKETGGQLSREIGGFPWMPFLVPILGSRKVPKQRGSRIIFLISRI